MWVFLTALVFFPAISLGTWGGKDVHPQEWETSQCWCEEHNLLRPSQTGVDGHNCKECSEVCHEFHHYAPQSNQTGQDPHFLLSLVRSEDCSGLCSFQWGQTAFIQRLSHFVCASEEHALWAETEGPGRARFFYQHGWVYPGPDSLWWGSAVHGVWKCFQGEFKQCTTLYAATKVETPLSGGLGWLVSLK